MLFPIGRSAARRLVGGAFRTPRAVFVSRPAAYSYNLAARGFATQKEPKAAAATKRTKLASTKKAPAKSAKPKKKKKLTKAVAKASKPKPKVSRISPERKAEKALAEERRTLKKLALLDAPPRNTVSTWGLFYAQKLQSKLAALGSDTKPTLAVTSGFLREIAEEYKATPESQKEPFRAAAEQQKLTRTALHKAWVASHTPQAIVEANNARKALKKKFNYPKSTVLHPIADDRRPVNPMSAWTLYNKARWASGEFTAGMRVTETIQQVAREWKRMTPAERQPYEDLAKSENERYYKEVERVFGSDKPVRTSKAVSAQRKAQRAVATAA